MNIVGKVHLLRVIFSQCIHSDFLKFLQFVRQNNTCQTSLISVNCGKERNIKKIKQGNFSSVYNVVD